jgi:hypothetical protein
MRRRIHVCHMRRRIPVAGGSSRTALPQPAWMIHVKDHSVGELF